MSRIALVGEGPLPGPDEAETSFAQLRLHQLHAGLSRHHDVRVVDVRADPPAEAVREIGPDCVVTAGVYGPTRAALAAAADLPLCLDLPGDPFADAQAVAAFGATEEVAREAQAVFVPALLRADRFTTISGPSRYALVGALGALGRLARTPPGHEWAHVVPVAWAFPGLSEGAPRDPAAPPRVALVGGFNTWFDAETLLDGLLLAMARAPLEVDCVGGPIPGHHTATWERFVGRVRNTAFAGRFHLHPRLPAAELGAILARCTVGVSLDRPGYEPELGSRTRLLLYLHQGLRVVGTARCELARDLVAGGWMTEVPCGDPAALASALLSAPPPLPDRAPLRTRFGTDATVAPLLPWLAAPARAGIDGTADTLLALTAERDALRETLAAVRASPTWRTLDRLRRATGR